LNIFFSFEKTEESTALNEAFEIGGFPYSNAMRNMGSTFIFMALNVSFIVMLILASIFPSNRLSLWVREKLMWNYFLRFMLQQYTTLLISALINMNRIDYSNLTNKIGTYLSFVTIGLCALFPFILTYLICIRPKMPAKEYEAKYGTISEGMRQNSIVGKYWPVFQIIKQIITIVVLV
jgi:hypothetical protein